MTTATNPDEFDAARIVVKTLETFGAEDQTRILRWAAERLGLTQPQTSQPPAPSTSSPSEPPQTQPSGVMDIRSFVDLKKPKNDSQFAAVVAYYNRFEAPEKKDSIQVADLLDACRKVNYPRPPAPGQTLRNAVNAGLLDKAERGAFSINSVGENLVAVTLPGDNTSSVVASSTRRPRIKRSRLAKKATQKKRSAKK